MGIPLQSKNLELGGENFYYWTQNERFILENQPFDINSRDKRLHVVKHNTREDSSIFTAGRAFLPAKKRQSIR